MTGLRVAFIDIMDDGELLKETFDIDTLPSIRLVKNGLVFQMPWQTTHVWGVEDFINFLQNHEGEKSNYLRDRV